MKYLFIHQNFPGQYLHIVRHLANQPDHEVVFISQVTQRTIPGVRNVFYNNIEVKTDDLHTGLHELQMAIRRGEEVYKTLKTLKGLGFQPDIIIGHQGWGEMLNVQDVYPDVSVLKYCEFYYQTDGLDVHFDPEFPVDELLPSRVRIKNTVNLVSANNTGWGQTPTLFQYSTYPAWAQKKISVLREGVNLGVCSPDPTAGERPFRINEFTIEPDEKLVTYVARGLEPYRGFHIFMRALPALLRKRQDVKVVIVGRDEVSYGAKLGNGQSWREFMLQEIGDQLDPSRICFAGSIPYPEFCGLLKRSNAHVYMTYPFVLSWSLREAMGMGCPIIASDTIPVREFIQDRETGVLTPFFDKDALTDRILEVLEDQAFAQKIRWGARREAERSLSMSDYLRHYEVLINDLIERRNPVRDFGISPTDILATDILTNDLDPTFLT